MRQLAPILARAARRRAVAALVAAAWCTLAGACPSQGAEVVARVPTAGADLVVVDDGAWRCFYFDGGEGLLQSCEHRREPHRVRFEYVRLMFAATLTVERPRSVLVLGLGGATLPRLVRTFYPDARLDVVEIEPAVVLMARRWFGFAPDERTTVHVQDARAFVEAYAGAPYDLVLVDCFDEEYIPPALRTLEFVQALERVVAPDGAVIANVFSRHPLYERLLATYTRVFPHAWRLPGQRATNHVVVVARAPFVREPARLAARAARVAAAAGRAWPYRPEPLLERFEPVPPGLRSAPALRDADPSPALPAP